MNVREIACRQWHHIRCRAIVAIAAASAACGILAGQEALAAKRVFLFLTLPSFDGTVISEIRDTYGSDAVIFGVFADPNASTTINGTEVRFTGYQATDGAGQLNPNNPGSVARYFVEGDLTLGPDDVIVSDGPHLLSIEVGNNANIAPGAIISASALSRTRPGPGGGIGGTATKRPAALARPLGSNGLPLVPLGGAAGSRGGNDAGTTAGPGTAGGTGSNAIQWTVNGTPYDSHLLISSLNGGSGASGVNDYYTHAGAGGAGVGNGENMNVGGTGGAGGVKGLDGLLGAGFPGGDGGNGNNGLRGPDGVDGVDGNEPVLASPPIFYRPLRAGSGGGAGATPGHGSDGGAGGGGGGGGSSGFSILQRASRGANGGQGGIGGLGGLPGIAGEGGAGGGGIELVVRGRLDASGATFAAAGASGSAGTRGTAGLAGGPSGPPESPTGIGGRGGLGGNGGHGGDGGDGGNGAAGGGGNFHIVAGVFNQGAGVTYDVSGSTQGLVQISSFGGSTISGQKFNRYAAGHNPYRSYRLPDIITLFGGELGPAQTPNLPDTQGGAAPYGRILNVDGTPNTAIGQAARPQGNLQFNVVGMVQRTAASTVTGGDPYSAYDAIAVHSFTSNLNAPKLSAVNADDAAAPFGGTVPNGPQPLRNAGYLNDPNVTPGATGPTVIASMGSNETWATLVESGKNFDVVASYQPYVAPRRFALSGSGTAQRLILDNGLLGVSMAQVTPAGDIAADFVTATGDSVDSSAHGSVFVRAGATADVQLTIKNIGNFNSRMTGSFSGNGAGGNYTNLAPTNSPVLPGAPIVATATVSGVGRQAGTTVPNALQVDFATQFDDFGPYHLDVTADAKVVGPIFLPTNVDDFTSTGFVKHLGDVKVGTSSFTAITFRNIANAIGLGEFSNLTDLGILDFSFTGPDADAFPLFQDLSGMTYQAGESGGALIVFQPTRVGKHEATLNIVTDMNAEIGSPGTTIPILLTATVVPEPGTATLLFGAAPLVLRRLGRRRLS